MSCGIYKIQNLINNKIYIGQSIDIETRWAKHKCAADNFAIHKALRKYGIENFHFSIVEECSALELDDKEKYWIAFYNSFKQGYNMTEGGSNQVGQSKAIAINQYSLDGTYIQSFQSIIDADRILKISSSDIVQVCKGKRSHAGGYLWRYSSEVPAKENIVPLEDINYKIRPVSQYTLQGKLLRTYNSITEAAEINNFKPSTICQNCSKRLKTAYGYIWAYKEDKIDSIKVKPIIQQYDLNNNLIAEFPTVTMASKSTNIAISGISECCHNKRKTAGGYIWKFN